MSRKVENKGKRWLAPSSVCYMNEAERAWIGAFIEAEGGIYPVKNRDRTWSISVYNNDLEIISALLRVTGAGRVAYGRGGLRASALGSSC